MRLCNLLALLALLAHVSGRVIRDGVASPVEASQLSSLINITDIKPSSNASAYSYLPVSVRAWNPPPHASAQLWNEATCKGNILYRCMTSTAQEAGAIYTPARSTSQSPRVDTWGDLITWGWRQYPAFQFNPAFVHLDQFWGASNILRQLRVSDQPTEFGGKNHVLFMRHGAQENGQMSDFYYVVNGHQYRTTGGRFVYAMNPEDGVIIAMDLFGPKYAVEQRGLPEDTALPDIKRATDVSWGMWDHLTNTTPGLQAYKSNIKWFFTLSVTNEDTSAIISWILEASGNTLSPFPGMTFLASTNEGMAMIGSPNGVGMGYLLAEHKMELGNLYVHEIAIFHCDTQHGFPCILWQIRPTP